MCGRGRQMRVGEVTGRHQRRSGKFLWGAVGVLIAVVSLSGCGIGAPGPDDSVRAHLDPVSGEIVMPMDEYAFYGRHADERTFAVAVEAVIGECMGAKGFTHAVAQVQADPSTDLDNRTFGIWEEQRAARYGWGHAVSPLSVALEKARVVGGANWVAAYEACAETDASVLKTMKAVTPPQDEYLNSLVSRLESEALSNARKDGQWREARELWGKCLAEAGLTAEEGENYASKQSSALVDAGKAGNTEEGIRLASIEARCNTKTRLTQRLADLEAAYQQPLIDANQAALNKEKERKQEFLLAARDYINTHG